MRRLKVLVALVIFLSISCKKENETTLEVLQGSWVEKHDPIFNRILKFNMNELIFFQQGSVDTFYYRLNNSEDTLFIRQGFYETQHHFYIVNNKELTLFDFSPSTPFQQTIGIFYKEN